MNTEEKVEYQDYMKNVRVTKSMIETAEFEGRMDERTKANREFTVRLIKNTDHDDEKIAELVGVEEKWVAAIRKELDI